MNRPASMTTPINKLSQEIQLPSEDIMYKAKILTEALPYMRRYAGKIFVIKYGGNAMGEELPAQAFARDVVLMKQVGIHPVIIHGGGPQIGKMLNQLAIKSEFVNGLRKTDQATVDVVEMVLSGKINKNIVSSIQAAGGVAIGISGKDASIIKAKKLEHNRIKTDSKIEEVVDLGFVGEPTAINSTALKAFIRTGVIPVIAPIGQGDNNETYNINADTAAGAIASALNADRLLLLTDIKGVLDENKSLIHKLNTLQAEELITTGVIHGGMIPKIETCIKAVRSGVDASVIVDGRIPHSLLLEIFTEDGVGTMIAHQ
jgi:acetylglutamate kinase